MKLTAKQRDRWWGDDGPYSQVNLIKQVRVLDDRVSRIFLVVEVEVNPLTYELAREHRDKFLDDPMILQLIDNADYRGDNFGYVAVAFATEYLDEDAMQRAEECLKYATETITKMHRFIMDIVN